MLRVNRWLFITFAVSEDPTSCESGAVAEDEYAATLAVSAMCEKAWDTPPWTAELLKV